MGRLFVRTPPSLTHGCCGAGMQDFGLDLSLADLGVKADEEGLIEFGQFKLLIPS